MDTRVAPGSEWSSGSVEQLASLTPLRGVAALWVVIFHFCWRIPTIHPERYTGAVYKGYLAVDVFFVLSGFVITHVYKDGFARRVTAWRYRNFLKARVARLYPLHVAMLLLFAATAMAERAAAYALNGSFDPIPLVGERSLSGFFANLVMLQGLWARQLSWNDPAWSISLEFLAYLLFPLLFPVLWRARRVGKAGIGCLLLAVLGWLAYCTGDYFNQWNGPYAILRCLTEFLVGSLLYSVYQSGQRLSKRPVRPAAGERRRIAGGSGAAGSAAAHRGARSRHHHAVPPPHIDRCPQHRLLRAAAQFKVAPLAGRYLVFSLPPSLVCPLPRHRSRAATSRNRLCDAAARHLAFTDGGHDRPQPRARRAQLSIYRSHGAPLAARTT